MPPIALLVLEESVGLTIAYGVLGALVTPFLSLTLLWLLNTKRTPRRWRNRIFGNVVMVLCMPIFVLLGGTLLVATVDSIF